MSKGTLKAVELLNDKMYLKLFTKDETPSDDIILIYKIFFRLLDKKDIYTEERDSFWKQTSEFFLSGRNLDDIKLGKSIIVNIF